MLTNDTPNTSTPNSEYFSKLIKWGMVKEIEKLCKLHPNYINDTLENNDTPLDIAILSDQLSVVKFLIRNGANIEARDKDNQTPLFKAIRLNCLDTVKFLIIKGANIEARDNENTTPLLWAILLKDRFDIVKFLIQKGANTEAPDNKHLTPSYIAWYLKHYDMSALLLKNPANPYSNDSNVINILAQKCSPPYLSLLPKYIPRSLGDLTSETRACIHNQALINRANELFTVFEEIHTKLEQNIITLDFSTKKATMPKSDNPNGRETKFLDFKPEICNFLWFYTRKNDDGASLPKDHRLGLCKIAAGAEDIPTETKAVENRPVLFMKKNA